VQAGCGVWGVGVVELQKKEEAFVNGNPDKRLQTESHVSISVSYDLER